MTDVIATGVMAIALVGLVVPNEDTAAANSGPASALISDWSTLGTTRTFQETSARLSYRGTWTTAAYRSYLSGKARSSRDPGARAKFQFTGNAVAWIGPVGPTRGQAKVYVDGKYVKTVNAYASAFRSTRVLFKASFPTAKARQLTVVVVGTKGHATVAIDAMVVRTDREPTPTRTAPIVDGAPAPTFDATSTPLDPSPQPPSTSAPEPTSALSPAPSAAPEPSESPTPEVPPTPGPTASPTVTPQPTSVPTPAPTTAPTPVPDVTPSPTLVPMPTKQPTPAPTTTPTAMPQPTAPPATGIAYGVFEDAGMVAGPSAMDAMITDLRLHNLQSVMFTNGSIRQQLPLADVTDARAFPVYSSWMMGDLYEQWWDRAASTTTIETARQVIGPMVDQLKVHPSMRGYNLIDDATPDRNELMRLAVQVFRERDPGRPASPMMVEKDFGQQVFDYVKPDAFLTYNYPADETTTPCSWTRTFVDEIRYTTRTKPASVPLWLVLQTHRTTFGADGSKLRYPTAEEVRLQNWMAVGEGAQGIWWFIYSSQQGWLGLRDQPLLYAEVSDIAKRTTALPRFTKQVDQVSAGSNYASTMTDSNGARYIVAANTSCAARAVTLSSSSLAGRLLDVETGETFSFGQAIPFRGGDGRIFRHLP